MFVAPLTSSRSASAGTVAVKVIDLEASGEDLQVVVQEVQFLASHKCPQIVNYLGTHLSGHQMWIGMEYCGGGSCSDLVKRHRTVPEDVVAYICCEVLAGLVYLHQRSVVHRDIKAANLLLTAAGGVKIGDFGVSGEISGTRGGMRTFVGTPFWMAPEVIVRHGRGGGYGTKADIWLLGITVMELLQGKPPYTDMDPMKALMEIPARDPPRLPAPFSHGARVFVSKCLGKDPCDRLAAVQLQRLRFARPSRRARQTLVQMVGPEREAATVRPRHRAREQPGALSVEWDFGGARLPSPCSGTLGSPLPGPGQSTPLSSALTAVAQLPLPLGRVAAALYRVARKARSPTVRERLMRLLHEVAVCEAHEPGVCRALLGELLGELVCG